MKTNAEIFWSDEDDGFIATDCTRPGCSAWNETEIGALAELRRARIAWDAAKKMATSHGQTEAKDGT